MKKNVGIIISVLLKNKNKNKADTFMFGCLLSIQSTMKALIIDNYETKKVKKNNHAMGLNRTKNHDLMMI